MLTGQVVTRAKACPGVKSPRAFSIAQSKVLCQPARQWACRQFWQVEEPQFTDYAWLHLRGFYILKR